MRAKLVWITLLLGLVEVRPSFSDVPLDVDCSLTPQKFAAGLLPPVRPTDINGDGIPEPWEVSNPFGEISDCDDVPGIPCSDLWHHTGEDLLVQKSSEYSQEKTIYAVDNGVVVFSTSGQSNPRQARGGLVLIKHIAPPETRFEIPSYQKTLEHGDNEVTISYEREFTTELASYYLHLGDVYVRQGDSVSRGQAIGRTYTYTEQNENNYKFIPHLHFEIWRKCTTNDSEGYERFGTNEFPQAAKDQVVSPTDLLKANDKEREIVRIVPVKLPDTGRVRISGAEFGNVPGLIQVTGQLLFSASRQTWSVSPSAWSDQEIQFNLLQEPLTARAFIISPLAFEVHRSDGEREGAFYYPFKDVAPNDWFSISVTSLWKSGLAEGPSGLSRFLPYDPINRSEFIKMLVQSVCPEGERECDHPTGTPNYTDVTTEHWFFPYIFRAWNLGWLDPSHTQFRPYDPLSRAEAAKMISLAADVALQTPVSSPYSDVQPTDWFAPYVIGLTEAGILTGYRDGSFKPGNTITRAEAANIINLVRP